MKAYTLVYLAAFYSIIFYAAAGVRHWLFWVTVFFLGRGREGCTAPFQMILLFIHRNSLHGHRSLAFSWENPKFPFIPYGRPNWIVSLNPCVPTNVQLFFFTSPRPHPDVALATSSRLQKPTVARS